MGTLQLQMYQLFLAAHYAHLFGRGLSLGVAPILSVQALDARGFQALAKFSNNPQATSDNGDELSWGAGGRVGLLWQPTGYFGVGVAWQTRIRMRESEDYAGLLPGGSLDMPSSLHIGTVLMPHPGHQLFVDVEHIRYEDSRPLSNPVEAQRLTDDCLLPRLIRIVTPGGQAPTASPACFGATTGPGLGWRNLTVYKVGYEYTHRRLSLRTGCAQSRRPMAADQALAAMVAPATSRRHLSVGLSWKSSARWGGDVMLQRAFPEHVEGRNPLSQIQPQLLPPAIEAGTGANDQPVLVELEVWQLGLSLSWTFGVVPPP